MLIIELAFIAARKKKISFLHQSGYVNYSITGLMFRVVDQHIMNSTVFVCFCLVTGFVVCLFVWGRDVGCCVLLF